MRVLHLPTNISSQISITVRALRDLGIEARGVAKHEAIFSDDYIERFPAVGSGPARFWRLGVRATRLLGLIQWADVVHWHYSWGMAKAMDVRIAAMLGKKRCVEFWGTDIRVTDIEAADNPVYASLPREVQKVAVGTAERSEQVQRTFARYGVSAILPCVSMEPFLRRDLFPTYFATRQRVYLPEFTPVYPDAGNRTPVVLHAPTNHALKGTSAVLAAVEALKGRLQFEYRQIERIDHAQALNMLAECDVYVDQLVMGVHGVAALEAMALGKPVICYIKPSMQGKYPPELPIVSATPETLTEVLAELLAAGQRRAELGRRGREYVERYHDAHKLAAGLAEFYRTL